jgi:hypothetical protein
MFKITNKYLQMHQKYERERERDYEQKKRIKFNQLTFQQTH